VITVSISRGEKTHAIRATAIDGADTLITNRFNNMKVTLITWLTPQLIRCIISSLSVTIRWKFIGNQYDSESDDQHIFAFWHCRLLMMGTGLKGCNGYTLISSHRDGGFIADTLALQGFKTIRGSSTHGGARALIRMIQKSKSESCDFGITPDGPKGPRSVVKPGIIMLAKKTGVKIYPVMWATSGYWQITSSWDHFYIPKPFSRGVFVFGDALFIAEDELVEDARIRIQSAMDAVQESADRHFCAY